MRLNQVHGYLIRLETSYNDGTTTPAAATDGANPYLGDGLPPAPEPIEYVYQGELGRAAGVLAPQRRTRPNGRFRRMSLPVLFKGAGAAYASAAVTPPNEVHRMLQLAGFDATFDTNHWDYTPTPAGLGFASGVLEDYRQQRRYLHRGVVANWQYTADGLGVPVHTFELLGLVDLPTDANLPAITYQATTVIPPVAAGVIANVGAFTAPMIRRLSYNRNRVIDAPRARMTAAGGHLGFTPAGTTPTWELELEKTALVASPFHTGSGFDEERLRDAATSVPWQARFGTVAGNRWTHGSAQVQVVNVQNANDESIATVTLTLVGHASTPSANDAEFVLFD